MKDREHTLIGLWETSRTRRCQVPRKARVSMVLMWLWETSSETRLSKRPIIASVMESISLYATSMTRMESEHRSRLESGKLVKRLLRARKISSGAILKRLSGIPRSSLKDTSKWRRRLWFSKRPGGRSTSLL